MLQVVASLMIIIQTTCTVLELQIMLLENKYSRVVTHDDRYMMIKLLLWYSGERNI